MNEELKSLEALTPEKDVLMTIFRNTADDYDVLASDMEALRQERSMLESRVRELNLEIEELIFAIEQTQSEEERTMLRTRLEVAQNTLAATVDRISQIDATLSKTSLYPEKMRYIQYIKDGKVQEYAPKMDNDGNIIYSDHD